MSHEVLITRKQSIFNFLSNPGRGGPQHPVPASTSQYWPSEARLRLDLQNNKKCYQDLMAGPTPPDYNKAGLTYLPKNGSPHVPIHSGGPGLAQGHLIPFVVELSNWMR